MAPGQLAVQYELCVKLPSKTIAMDADEKQNSHNSSNKKQNVKAGSNESNDVAIDSQDEPQDVEVRKCDSIDYASSNDSGMVIQTMIVI